MPARVHKAAIDFGLLTEYARITDYSITDVLCQYRPQLRLATAWGDISLTTHALGLWRPGGGQSRTFRDSSILARAALLLADANSKPSSLLP
jgi:hypothetical protein